MNAGVCKTSLSLWRVKRGRILYWRKCGSLISKDWDCQVFHTLSFISGWEVKMRKAWLELTKRRRRIWDLCKHILAIWKDCYLVCWWESCFLRRFISQWRTVCYKWVVRGMLSLYNTWLWGKIKARRAY